MVWWKGISLGCSVQYLGTCALIDLFDQRLSFLDISMIFLFLHYFNSHALFLFWFDRWDILPNHLSIWVLFFLLFKLKVLFTFDNFVLLRTKSYALNFGLLSFFLLSSIMLNYGNFDILFKSFNLLLKLLFKLFILLLQIKPSFFIFEGFCTTGIRTTMLLIHFNYHLFSLCRLQRVENADGLRLVIAIKVFTAFLFIFLVLCFLLWLCFRAFRW